MPDEEPVVWPEDPAEGDAHPEEAEPASPAAAESDWPATFDEALKQSQAQQEPAPASEAPAAAAEAHDYPTQPSLPAVPAKTVPPEPAQPSPVEQDAPVLG